MASGKTMQTAIEITGVLSPSLQSAIKNAVDKLDSMAKETLESADAASRLAAEMSAQEDVLKTMQKAYAGYVASGEESSEQAQTLADKIQTVSEELEDNRSVLRAAEKAASKLLDTQEDTADAYDKLEKTIKDQEDELEKLRREYAKVVLEQGESSKEAKQLSSKMTALNGDLSKNKTAMNSAKSAASSLASALDSAGDAASSSSDGYTVLKDVISDLASDAISSAVDAFKELALEGDNALALLEARTGSTSGEMEGFEDVMNNVYGAGYGDDIGDVSSALSTVIQLTDDLDNASLEKVTKNAMALDKVYGYDTTESMRAVNSLMNKFGITSDEAFNLVVQGAQKGLDQNGDLLDTINEYSNQFASAGFSADDMFNMLANGAAEGTWSVDKLGDAVKEYNIRMSDGTASDALMDNYKAMGLTKKEAKALSKAYGAGGEAGAAAMESTLDAILAVKDENKRYQLGVAMFGTMWEDLGEDTVAALFNTEGAIDSSSDAMGRLNDAAYDTLGGALSRLGRTLKANLIQPIVDKVTPGLTDFINSVTDKVGPAIDWLTEHVPGLGAVILGLGAAFAAVKVAKFASGISGLFGTLKSGLGGVMSALGGGSTGGGKGGGLLNIKGTAQTMGSIALAIGGVAAIVAAFGALKQIDGFDELMADGGASLSQLCDIIADVGLVGGAFVAFTAVVGKAASIADVATGMADIAIAMGGMGAIVTAFGALSQIEGFNGLITAGGETLNQLCGIIEDIGLIGGAFVVAAGLIGTIPIATLTAGMANIAVALGGMEAIVLAFGALKQIEGIDTFMTAGGEMLTQLCGIIGNMAGTLIGSLAEGITDSLPAIGTNLADFATNMKPMFDTFANADTDAISGFASSFAAFIAVLAGESLLSVITGGIDYAGLGTKLNTMATGLTGFFGSVMTFPEGCFDRASALFDCLAGISSMPKEGGVVGWFEGEVDYSKMATGLTQLAGAVGFFTAVQSIPETAFTAATSLFDCLAGISSLPTDGGIVGWFTGTVNYADIAAGVQSLASTGMIAALTTLATLPAGSFTNLTAMFDALAGIKAMPTTGGIAGWFTGDATSTLTSVSSKLPQVATDIAAFFTALGGRSDFSPISNLFNTLSDIKIDSDAASGTGLFGAGASQMEQMGTALSTFATKAATFFTKINALNVENLKTFFVELSSINGLPATLISMDTAIGTALSNILTTTETKMTAIRDAINLDTSTESVSGSMGSINSSVNTGLGTAMMTTSTAFQSIFQTISDKINSARDAVTSAITAIKNAFNFSWSLPKLKLPHVKINGEFSINPPSVPKFSVSWYKEGGILTQPTVFGAAGNTLLAGGEAGAEAVLPLAVLWDKLEHIMFSTFDRLSAADSGVGLTATAGRLLTLDDFSLGSLSDNNSLVIYYDFSGFTWSPQVQTGGDDKDDLMARLKAHEAEFFDWLEEFIQMREVAQYA